MIQGRRTITSGATNDTTGLLSQNLPTTTQYPHLGSGFRRVGLSLFKARISNLSGFSLGVGGLPLF